MKLQFFRPIMQLLFVGYCLLTRAMTLGVRAVLIDNENRVFLVRHTYVDGWHLPGGGVERGETLRDATIKECYEEGCIQVKGEVKHFHTYLNPRSSRFDHVALMVCDDWEQLEGWQPDREIAEIGFFPIDDLPQGVTQSTRNRLAEVLDNHTPSDRW